MLSLSNKHGSIFVLVIEAIFSAFEEVIRYNLFWGRLCLKNNEVVYASVRFSKPGYKSITSSTFSL